ncbi:MAG: hypothetical protein QOE45_1136 [Frankiaceae bacterium]|nr:hypothetical protein [Frankiaceae bacterium]
MVAPDLPVAPRREPRRLNGVAVQALAIVLLLVAGLVRVAVVRHDNGAAVTLRPALVGAAPAAARKQRTARGELTITLNAARTVTERGTGEFDFANSRSAFDFDLGEVVASTGAPRNLSMVSDATRLWVHVPASRTSLNGGKPWVVVDAPLKAAGITPDVTSDPSKILDRLTLAGGTAVEVGREDVRGVPTVKYHFEVPVEPLFAQLAPTFRDRAVEVFKDAGIETLGYDVWLDRDGLPRKISNELALGPLTATTTFELFDYGRPVTITVPSDAETRSAPSLGDAMRIVGLPTAGLTG